MLSFGTWGVNQFETHTQNCREKTQCASSCFLLLFFLPSVWILDHFFFTGDLQNWFEQCTATVKSSQVLGSNRQLNEVYLWSGDPSAASHQHTSIDPEPPLVGGGHWWPAPTQGAQGARRAHHSGKVAEQKRTTNQQDPRTGEGGLATRAARTQR